MLQVFDDGSTIETDGAGNVLRVTDSNGAIVEPDTSIFGDFARQMLGGASAAVRDYLRTRSAPATTTVAPAMVSGLPTWAVPAAALGVGAWLLFKSRSS